MLARSSRAALAIIATLSLHASACGSDSDPAVADASTEGADDASAEGVEAAKAFLADYLEPASDFPLIDSPLTKSPGKKTVGFVVCPDPSCVDLAKFLKQGTDALGWTLKTVNANDWSDPGSAIQQLIDANVDYISLTGFPIAQYESQMAAMKAKGIPLFQAYSTDVPEGEANNLYSDSNDASSAEVFARVIADWVIVDSGGDAKVLNVTLGTTPILDAQVAAAKDEFEMNCPGCSFDVLTGTQNDLVTAALPQQVVSYLQTNPDTDYVYFAYTSLGTGVVSALKSAGLLDQVKIVGTMGGKPQFQEIIDGTSAAWTALPAEFAMWTVADQMARFAAGEWSLELERESAIPPLYVVQTVEQAKAVVDLPAGWAGPDGFKDAFRKLWGI